VLDACRELNIALIAYSPLAQGVLTGKYRNGNTPLPSLPRRRVSQRGFGKLENVEPLFLAMEEAAQAHNKTLAQVSLNWLLETDVHIIPIPGAKTLRQAQENAGTLGWRLNDVEYARIAQAAQPWLHA
jgi:aryl-alcohol dehydrogenase-like predicted oxidoreductase